MRHAEIPIPELSVIAATRGILGAGVALLLGDRLEPRERHKLGAVLAAVGVLSTIPLAYDVFFRRSRK